MGGAQLEMTDNGLYIGDNDSQYFSKARSAQLRIETQILPGPPIYRMLWETFAYMFSRSQPELACTGLFAGFADE